MDRDEGWESDDINHGYPLYSRQEYLNKPLSREAKQRIHEQAARLRGLRVRILPKTT